MQKNQKQNLVNLSSKKELTTNFLKFFNLKMLRYSLFKQLKAVSSYVLVILMVVVAFGCLISLFMTPNDGNLARTKENIILYKFVFFLLYFPFFTMLIAFKSVQMIRDEIDDGTLLIFNSMPYTRTRMIIEKWLSVQIVCLFYSIIVLFLPSSTAYLAAKIIANNDTILNFKMLFTLIDTMFLTSFIIQLLLTTLAILLSIVLSGKATAGLVSTFGSLAFVGPVLIMILNAMNSGVGEINANINYYEKAIRESGLRQYIDDPETKKYFEFNGWSEKNGFGYTQSISEVRGNSIGIAQIFDIKSENDLAVTVAKFKTSPAGAIEKEQLDRFKTNGIKVDTNTIALKSDMRIENIKAAYDKVKWKTSEPLVLTSYLKTDYNNVSLFETGTKLEKIRQILNSDYFSNNYDINNSYYNKRYDFGIQYNDLAISGNDTSDAFENNIRDLIEQGQIGSNYKKDKVLELNQLFLNNAQYHAFLNFMQNLKDIATSFQMTNGDKSTQSREPATIEQLNITVEAINKYDKTFKLNNYLNWWTQWYMMWHGDLRLQSGQLSSMFLVPNSTANFAISKNQRSFYQLDPSAGAVPKELKENYIVIDLASVKPIVNMTGLYATYLSLSLVLAAATLFLVIRRDFV